MKTMKSKKSKIMNLRVLLTVTIAKDKKSGKITSRSCSQRSKLNRQNKLDQEKFKQIIGEKKQAE
jgi:hypothetical protein